MGRLDLFDDESAADVVRVSYKDDDSESKTFGEEICWFDIHPNDRKLMAKIRKDAKKSQWMQRRRGPDGEVIEQDENAAFNEAYIVEIVENWGGDPGVCIGGVPVECNVANKKLLARRQKVSNWIGKQAERVGEKVLEDDFSNSGA